jgi:hypothetical protein
MSELIKFTNMLYMPVLIKLRIHVYFEISLIYGKFAFTPYNIFKFSDQNFTR